jgi:hypothetical protein
MEFYRPQNRQELKEALRSRWPSIKCSRWHKARLWAVWYKMRKEVSKHEDIDCRSRVVSGHNPDER